MTDPRPAPRWGEYADVPPAAPPVAAEPPLPDPAPAPVRPRRTGDMVITVALLVIGLYDVIVGFGTYANLTPIFTEVFAQQGFGEFTSVELATTVGMVANVLRVTILVATIAISLWLMSRGRRAFWVPLVGGAVAIIVVIICFIIVMANDPALATYIDNMG